MKHDEVTLFKDTLFKDMKGKSQIPFSYLTINVTDV